MRTVCNRGHGASESSTRGPGEPRWSWHLALVRESDCVRWVQGTPGGKRQALNIQGMVSLHLMHSKPGLRKALRCQVNHPQGHGWCSGPRETSTEASPTGTQRRERARRRGVGRQGHTARLATWSAPGLGSPSPELGTFSMAQGCAEATVKSRLTSFSLGGGAVPVAPSAALC